MKPKSPCDRKAEPPLAVLSPAARWAKLLQHPHFRTPSDLPKSARSRMVEHRSHPKLQNQQSFDEKWAKTTPLGREIIRKKLYALEKAITAARENARAQTKPERPY